MNRYAFAAGAAVLSLLPAACGSSETTSKPSPVASATSAEATAGSGGVVIKSFAYSGTTTVKTGEKVTVTNQDPATHTLTAKTRERFDSGDIEGSGKTGTFTAPPTAGSYPFGCKYHPQMAGTLTVTG